MKNGSEKVCFYSDSFKDYDGKMITVCWSEELWNTHLNKHPEIMDAAHTSKLINEAILEPSLVLTGYKPGDAKEMLICYYKEHKSHGNEVFFSKVVVGCTGTELYVKTVFQEWAVCMYAVQEKKYNFKELYREVKTLL